MSVPFFALLGTAIKRSLFSFINIIYLYRVIATIIRIRNSRPNNSFGSSVSDINEAYKILELERNCSRQDIISAHKEKIKKAHPDKSGNTEAASQINRARDILLEIHK